MVDSSRVVWLDDLHLLCEGVRFRLDVTRNRPVGVASDGEVVLMKPRADLVDAYVTALEPFRHGNVVEIGIWGGGSTILYHLLMRPRKMVAIELETEASETLARYIRDNQLENQIVPYYGVDQGDVEAVRGIMLREFGDVQLDVVIDDASHQYALTKRAFNVLFPLLRSGGKYFVEDWGWAHWQGRYQQHWMDDPALSNLIFELTMVVATWGGYMVARVDVQHAFVAVERGTGRLPSKFDISSLYLTRGRKFELL